MSEQPAPVVHPPCPDCVGWDGWREIAHHFDGAEGPTVYVGMAACSCARGRQRPGAEWSLVAARFRQVPGTTAVYVSDRDETRLLAEHRHPPEVMARRGRLPEQAYTLVKGRLPLAIANEPDRFPGERAAHVGAERRRDAAGRDEPGWRDDLDDGAPVW